MRTTIYQDIDSILACRESSIKYLIMTIRKSLNELNILGNMSSKFPCNSEANTSELHENLEDTFTGVKCLV